MNNSDTQLLGEGLDYGRMPGHWLLAQMGKRVLRPGGIELTRRMLESLEIGTVDSVVELAPGLGVTARAALERSPLSYIGVERDENAARHAQKYLAGEGRRCIVGRAEDTGLPDESATVVFGEAMLTMQTPSHKAAIVTEARRLLQAGGRYGIHELCLHPDDLDGDRKSEINRVLSGVIRVGARPSTPAEWKALLEGQGFQVELQETAPMHLLEPRRFLRDEGLARSLRFMLRIVRNPVARRRILQMRSVFREYQANLAAIAIVAVRK